MNPNSPLGRWLPVFLWALVIFALSSIKQVVVSEFFIWDFVAKKIAHVGEYAVFFVLIYRATGGKWLATFSLTMIYAVSDEIHQSFVPGRNTAVYDLGFDFSGASIAAYVIWKRQAHQKRKHAK